MAKSKYAPALFEVIDSHSKSKKKNSLALPKWWKNSTGKDETSSESESGATPESAAPTTAQDAGTLRDENKHTGASESLSGAVPTPGTPEHPSAIQPPDAARQVKPPQPSTFSAITKPPARDERSREHRQIASSPAGSASGVHDASRLRDFGTADHGATPKASAPTSTGQDATLLSRLARVEEGRVVLSLTPINLGFVAGGLLIALFAAFMAGRSTAPVSGERGQTADEGVFSGDLGNAANSKADPGVLALNNTPGVGSEAEGSDSGSSGQTSDNGNTDTTANASRHGRKIGLNYIILQYFYEGDREDAVQARQWLATKGVETTLERSAVNNGWLLITTRGFDYNTPNGRQSAEAFREEIIQLGKKYRSEFGAEARYTFHEPLIRKEQ